LICIQFITGYLRLDQYSRT